MRHALLGLALLTVAGCERPAEEPAASEGAAQPEVVAVDWLGRGTLYAATVTDRREGFTRVRYADGEQEWVEASRLRPWPDLSGGAIVQYYTGSRPVDVTVIETREGLLHVRRGEEGWS